MAEKKKTTADTAVRKAMPKNTKTVKSSGGIGACNAYKALRNVLDGLQFKAIDYYSKGSSDAEKERRSAALRNILLQAYSEMEKLPSIKGDDDSCPPENRCNGVCLPYECP